MLGKFNGNNFYNWKVKIQLFLLTKNLWGIINGSETTPTDQFIKCSKEQGRERAKSIIGLNLSDSQLHLIDLKRSFAEMWEQLTQLFREKSTNAKFSLKLHLFKLIMHKDTSLSARINELKSLMRQLIEIKDPVEEDDAKSNDY